MDHPAFAEAGSSSGIEIWTIDQFEPVPIDQKSYGKFYNGDCYIVLKTTGVNNSSLKHDAHFWIGSKSSQDKSGSAAIWTVTLDDMLGGKAVQHREVQGHESSQFVGYFKPAIRYLEGGNDSGFTEVETNAGAEKRLLKLSGCDNMRIEEVPAEFLSLTKEHCFVLENDHDIWVLMPEGAKATHRRKIITVANHLRDEYHHGRATIEILDDFSSDEDIDNFFSALGSGSRDDLASSDTDDSYTRDDMSAVYLYRVLLGDTFELISLSKPYKQKSLSSEEVYILDTPSTGVYVWMGKDLDADTKKNYNNIVQSYLEAKGYPNWVKVTKVAEGAESSSFKQYFHNWDSIGEIAFFTTEADAGYFSSDAEESAAIAKLIGKSAAARGFMPDQGDGSLLVTRIAGDAEDVTAGFLEGVAVMYTSEVYVIKYKYTNDDGDDAYVVYWWIGVEASDADKKTGFDLVAEIEDELEGNVTLVKIPQGKEPKHFLSLFKGKLAILFGSKDDDYKPVNANQSYDDDGIRLFRVEGTQPEVDMRAVQVPEKAELLEDDDVFVLETQEAIYVWIGKESDPTEKEAALNFLQTVVSGEKEIIEVEQGGEPDEFWAALGGQAPENEDSSGWKKVVSRRVTAAPTLTDVIVNVSGKIKLEDLPEEYTQEDLSDDSIYILDTGEELFLWEGKNIPERVKMARNDVVKEFIKNDGLERTVDSALVVSVKQGKEPKVFKKLFPEWSDDMWDNQASYEDIKNEAKASNSK